jgi:hypothetical protein
MTSNDPAGHGPGSLTTRHLAWMERAFFPAKTLEDSLRHDSQAVSKTLAALTLSLEVPVYISAPIVEGGGLRGDPSVLYEQRPALTFSLMEGLSLMFRGYELALHGAYNASQILLRGAVEVVGNGAMTDFLAQHLDEELAHKDSWTPPFRKRARESGLLAKLLRLQGEGERSRRGPVEFASVLLGEAFRNLTFGAVGPQLAAWGLTDPIQDPLLFIEYDELCRSVHVAFTQTDFIKQIDALVELDEAGTNDESKEPPTFSRLLPKELELAAARARNVAEMIGVVGANLSVVGTNHRGGSTLGQLELLAAACRKADMTTLAKCVERLTADLRD